MLQKNLQVDVCEDERASVLLVEEGAEGRVEDGREGLHRVEAERLATKYRVTHQVGPNLPLT